MRFIETPIFTKGLRKILPDEDYRALQLALLLRPEQGPIIPGPMVSESLDGVRKVKAREVVVELFTSGIKSDVLSTCSLHMKKARRRILLHSN